MLIILPLSLSFSLCSDSYIVRVKAVVMTRDDSSGGWLAQDGGALSRVGVCRLLPTELALLPTSSCSQFLIRGERLRDKQVKPRRQQNHFKVHVRERYRGFIICKFCSDR